MDDQTFGAAVKKILLDAGWTAPPEVPVAPPVDPVPAVPADTTGVTPDGVSTSTPSADPNVPTVTDIPVTVPADVPVPELPAAPEDETAEATDEASEPGA